MQKFHILCVDDDMSVLRMLGKLLMGAGHQVEMAKNGFVALQKLSRNPQQFQLVITDIRMPGMDGYALIQQARLAGYTGSFVVYAGMISPDDREHLRELGVSKVIVKPAPFSELISTVRDLHAMA